MLKTFIFARRVKEVYTVSRAVALQGSVPARRENAMVPVLSFLVIVLGLATGLMLTVIVIRPVQAARRAERLARIQRDFRRQRIV